MWCDILAGQVMDAMCVVDGRCDGMWCRVVGCDVIGFGTLDFET